MGNFLKIAEQIEDLLKSLSPKTKSSGPNILPSRTVAPLKSSPISATVGSVIPSLEVDAVSMPTRVNASKPLPGAAPQTKKDVKNVQAQKVGGKQPKNKPLKFNSRGQWRDPL
jgi:hypothetical protein